MKRFQFVTPFLIGVLIFSACNLPVQNTPQPGQTPASQPAATTSVLDGKLIASNGVEFAIPTGLGTDATSIIVPEVAAGGMGESPAYLQFSLQGYPLSAARVEPQIRVYSVQELAKYNWGQGALVKLRAILANPLATPNPDAAIMPSPYANAGVIMASNLKPLSPAGVSGVRMIASFGQAILPIMNDSLAYQFHGLSADGKFYVMALLPVTAPFLETPGSPLPPDGVALTMDSTLDAAAYKEYIKQISDRLNAAEAANTLSPSILLMDGLLQSLKLNTAGIVLPAPMPTAESPVVGQPTATPSAALRCDAAQFVADVTYKDDTEVNAGESFTKTWRIKNSGSCEWEGTYTLVFASGDKLNATSPAVALAAPNAVAPGGVIDVSVPMQAPSKKGTYEGYWHLYNRAGALVQKADGSPFQLSVRIVVKKDSAATPVLPEMQQTFIGLAKGKNCTQNAVYLITTTIVSRGPYLGTYTLVSQVGNTSKFNGSIDAPQGKFTFTANGQTYEIATRLQGPYDDPNKLRVIFTIDGNIMDSVKVCP
jgi:hypothetical protein